METARPAVVVDFDGTITTTDSSEALARRFAGPGWEEIQRQYASGAFGMRTWHQRIPALMNHNTCDMLDYLLPRLQLRQGFVAFCQYAADHRLRLVVASDGLGFYIAPFLRSHGLEWLEVRTNTFSQGVVSHPHGHPGCPVCGNCKARTVRELRRQSGRVVFVGDGFNDRFGSSHADAVLALSGGRLEEHCVSRSLPHWSWRDFCDVKTWFEQGPIYPGPHPVCPSTPEPEWADHPADR